MTEKTVNVGCWVKIAGFDPDEEETYYIVDDPAAQPTEFRIAQSSPLARALLGKQQGDRIPFHTPAGDFKLTIVDLGED